MEHQLLEQKQDKIMSLYELKLPSLKDKHKELSNKELEEEIKEIKDSTKEKKVAKKKK